MFPCFPACSTGVVADTRRSDTQFLCRPARFPVGLQTSFFLPTQIGNVTTLPVCDRLIRDGVDIPLADLFVAAAQRTPSADPAARARSASEGFLYRRLQTLSGARGKFQLNANLANPFDGLS